MRLRLSMHEAEAEHVTALASSRLISLLGVTLSLSTKHHFNPIVMSGIEVAGLVFGVVPVVVETLKSYSFVRNKLHACRHYSQEVEEVVARLTSARTNFNNEVQLLRRCLKCKAQVDDLGDDIDLALEESFKSCITTIERVKRILDKMQAEMAKFDELLEKKAQVDMSIWQHSLVLTHDRVTRSGNYGL